MRGELLQEKIRTDCGAATRVRRALGTRRHIPVNHGRVHVRETTGIGSEIHAVALFDDVENFQNFSLFVYVLSIYDSRTYNVQKFEVEAIVPLILVLLIPFSRVNGTLEIIWVSREIIEMGENSTAKL